MVLVLQHLHFLHGARGPSPSSIRKVFENKPDSVPLFTRWQFEMSSNLNLNWERLKAPLTPSLPRVAGQSKIPSLSALLAADLSSILALEFLYLEAVNQRFVPDSEASFLATAAR